MANAALTSPSRRTDWLSRAWTVPSWLASLLVHAGVIALLVAWSQHWQPPPAGFTDDPSREIGIVIKETPGTALEVIDTPAENPVDVAPPSEAVAATTPIELPTSIPPLTPSTANTPSLTAPALPVVGTGPPASATADARDLIKGAPGKSAQAAHAAAIPGAAFMGARDQGTRVVFVVDCSASMANDSAMRTAKAALVASLQSLTEAQQFQIIFYNQTPTLLKLRNHSPAEMAFATEVNKTFARQHIAGIEPDLGTDHMPALKMALRLNPEVIFFLTDADEPQLSTGELNEIKRLNQGRTRIHTIEFARGAELGENINFLKKLASQNGGTYRYHDVRRMAVER